MGKPIARKLVDDYAIETGNIYICVYSGLCARGETHAEAFNKLREHFEFLRSPRPVPIARMC